MKETLKYLQDKIVEFTDERNGYAKNYNDNRDIIIETKNQIDKINKQSDEAMEIFSPKTRESNSFNKNEISNLEVKIVTLSEVNNGLSNKVKKLDDEIIEIRKCITELEKNKKPRTRKSNTDNVSRDMICGKLKHIENLIFTEPYTAQNEIIKMIDDLEIITK